MVIVLFCLRITTKFVRFCTYYKTVAKVWPMTLQWYYDFLVSSSLFVTVVLYLSLFYIPLTWVLVSLILFQSSIVEISKQRRIHIDTSWAAYILGIFKCDRHLLINCELANTKHTTNGLGMERRKQMLSVKDSIENYNAMRCGTPLVRVWTSS